MKSGKIKCLIIFLIVALIFALGFYRDFVFVNINFRLNGLWYNKNLWQLPASLSFFENFSYNQLYYAKWLLTLLFSLSYLLLYLACVKVLFQKKNYLLWTIFIFAGIYIVSAPFYILSYFSDSRSFYIICRILMDFVQSPLLIMILVPAFLLDSKRILKAW
jgi:hypothetical protein